MQNVCTIGLLGSRRFNVRFDLIHGNKCQQVARSQVAADVFDGLLASGLDRS